MQSIHIQQKLIARCIRKGMSQTQIFQQLQEQRDAFKKLIKFPEAFARSTVKRSIMVVSSYSGSLRSSSDYIVDSLEEAKSEILNSLSKNEMNHYLNAVYDSIQIAIPAAAKYMDYIGRVNRLALRYSDSISFISPVNGMPVKIVVKEQEKTTIAFRRNASMIRAVINKVSDKTNNRKTATTSIPGIYHHLDSAILESIITILDFDIAPVHDSVGMHPNNIPQTYDAVRKSMFKISQGTVLRDIAAQIMQDVPEKLREKMLDQCPYTGDWDTVEQDLQNNIYAWS